MKSKMHFTFLWPVVFLLPFLLFSCEEDNNDNKNFRLQGKWILMNTAPQAEAVSGSFEEAHALEDSLTSYTFFTEGSEITFDNDSIYLTARIPGYTLPLTLAYRYEKDVINIQTPYNLSFYLEGTVELQEPVMQIRLTTESYDSILDFLRPSFRGRILSATVNYELQRKQ